MIERPHNKCNKYVPSTQNALILYKYLWFYCWSSNSSSSSKAGERISRKVVRLSHTSNINIYYDLVLATGGAFTATAPLHPFNPQRIPRMEITL